MSTGMDMYPRTWQHSAKTDSKGFCFLPEQVRVQDYANNADGEIYILSPLECLDFLRGIVSEDVLVEFEAPKNALRQSWGGYASIFSDDGETRCTVDELCCDSYNRDEFIPLRYAPHLRQYWNGQYEWYQYN